MIQSSPLTANFSVVSVTKSPEVILDDIADRPYDPSTGFGFKIEEDRGGAISGYLVESQVVKKRTYDEEHDQITEIEVNEKELIPFYIDAHEGLLEVYSDQSNTRKVTTRIGEATGWSIGVKDSPLNLPKIYQYFRQKEFIRSVSSLRITNFKTDESISGTYTIKSIGSETANQLISNSNGNLTVLRLDLNMEGTNFKIGLYRSGSVRIYSNLADDEKVWKIIRTAVTTVQK